ncbi:flavodoxin family protein [Syntrophomonas erecta]
MSDLLIIGINGSPHKNGNTAHLLQIALDYCSGKGAKTHLINCTEVMRDQSTPFCMACSSPCSTRCFQGKRLEKELELITRADGLIVGSPVYFGTVSAQLKAFWDKTRSLRTDKKLLNTVGGAITVGGSRFGGQETTQRAIHDIFLVQGMILVGDGYYEDDCGHMGVAAQRPSDADTNAVERTRILAKRIMEVAQATRMLRIRP